MQSCTGALRGLRSALHSRDLAESKSQKSSLLQGEPHCLLQGCSNPRASLYAALPPLLPAGVSPAVYAACGIELSEHGAVSSVAVFLGSMFFGDDKPDNCSYPCTSFTAQHLAAEGWHSDFVHVSMVQGCASERVCIFLCQLQMLFMSNKSRSTNSNGLHIAQYAPCAPTHSLACRTIVCAADALQCICCVSACRCRTS